MDANSNKQHMYIYETFVSLLHNCIHVAHTGLQLSLQCRKLSKLLTGSVYVHTNSVQRCKSLHRINLGLNLR